MHYCRTSAVVVVLLFFFGGLVPRASDAEWAIHEKHGEEILQAVFHRDADTLERLLADGGNPNTLDRRGDSALDLAIDRQFAAGASLLTKYGAIRTILSPDWAPAGSQITVGKFLSAARQGKTQVVRSYIEAGGNPNAKVQGGGESALHIAAQRGDRPMVELLLDSGAFPDMRSADRLGERTRHSLGLAPAFRAARQGHFDLVRLFLERGVDVNTQDVGPSTLLTLASWHGESAAVQFLLENGADPDLVGSGGHTPVCIAAAKGDIQLLETLLNAGARADNPSGNNPLVAAINSGAGFYERLFNRLINSGAVVNPPLDAGEAPIIAAARKGNLEALRILSNHGADVGVQDRHGATALFPAAVHADIRTMRALLELGPCVNHQEKSGLTPLMLAVRQGTPEMVSLLLSAGADPNLTTFDGTTALQIARRKQDSQKTMLLLDGGARDQR